MGGIKRLMNIPRWALSSGLLFMAALFFKFALRGYSYIAYTLTFFAALIVLHRFLSPGLWKIVAILVCIGLVYFTIVEIPIIKNTKTDKDPERDYLIVLGAAVHGDDASLSLVHRLRGVMDYMEEYPNSIAIVSGGKGQGENITEAQCMFDWLTERGVDPDRIIMEDKATSTKENLLFSFEIIRQRGDDPEGNVAVLSSPYHLYRAKTICKMLGVEAAGVAGHWDYPALTVSQLIREAFGMTHLWVFGW